MLGNTFLHAGGHGQNVKKPHTLKEYIERGKQDNVMLAGNNNSGAIVATGIALGVAVRLGGPKLLAKLDAFAENACAADNYVKLSAQFNKEAMEYALKNDKELYRLLSSLQKNNASYTTTIAAVEAFEIKRNIEMADAFMADKTIGNFYGFFSYLRETGKLREIIRELPSGKINTAAKESAYMILETAGILNPSETYRIRRFIYNHAGKAGPEALFDAYINERVIKYELNTLKSVTPAKVKFYRLFKRFFIVGALLTVAVSADAATSQKIERITNNFNLIFEADDHTIAVIEKDKEFAAVIKAILDTRHEIAIGTEEQKEAYRKEYEAAKKEITFNPMRDKFSSYGTKTGR
ncbi:hypothetical protein AAIR98_001129 [Elusimicrobium simillimum]|uniref:hypothetical protein n=1 Tax=Elusimicrobium simillimum TaxID=3143438 RepID=UPI003C6FAD2F